MPSPLSKQRDSPLSRQLRSPRGSPRPSSSAALVLPLVSQRHFRYVVLCCFPLLLLFQWSMTVTPSSTTVGTIMTVPHDLQLMQHALEEDSRRRQYAPRKKGRSLSVSTMTKEGKKQHNDENDHRLASYNYALHPIIPNSVYIPHSDKPLSVILLGSSDTKDEEKGLLLDGLERSRYIKVIRDQQDWRQTMQQQDEDATTVVVHIVDWAALDHDCHFLEQMYQGTMQPVTHWLVYFDTSASTRVTVCAAVNALFANHQFRVVKQSIVHGRHWNARKAWVSTGQIMAQPDTETTGAGPILHAPHFLRERFVDLLIQAVQATTKGKVSATHELLSQIVKRPRKLDVVHVWRKGDASHYGRLRRQVSVVIQELNGTKLDNGRSLRWLVRPRGDDFGAEEGLIQPEYVASLISSKIVVVAQRDEWEDHFRLLESLASGALVLTDTMLATPHGLKNGTSILTYHDAKSLRNLLLYYAHPDHDEERISIAQRGWEIAMGRHRSWHRLEQVLFGAARSKVGKPLEAAPSRRRSIVDS